MAQIGQRDLEAMSHDVRERPLLHAHEVEQHAPERAAAARVRVDDLLDEREVTSGQPLEHPEQVV